MAFRHPPACTLDSRTDLHAGLESGWRYETVRRSPPGPSDHWQGRQVPHSFSAKSSSSAVLAPSAMPIPANPLLAYHTHPSSVREELRVFLIGKKSFAVPSVPKCQVQGCTASATHVHTYCDLGIPSQISTFQQFVPFFDIPWWRLKNADAKRMPSLKRQRPSRWPLQRSVVLLNRTLS
jgi:hypothetical protein